jgi:hypothetical protein
MFARGGVAQPVIDANQIGAAPAAASSRMAG